jgi:ferredoxin
MQIDTVQTILFSPTGTTRSTLEAIVQGMEAREVVVSDMTFLRQAEPPQPLTDGVALIGVPVYAGRVPARVTDWLRSNVAGAGRPAVLVVVYGNRAFEDALLELRDLAEELGFRPVAGAAFIGEHSFSTPGKLIAPGRPDDQDVEKAREFGRLVREKLRGMEPGQELSALSVPGNMPYRKGVQPGPVAPETVAETCILCGMCAEVCPAGVVSVGQSVKTDRMGCLRCCACIRACPTGARVFDDPNIRKVADMLYTEHNVRREPDYFL